MTLLYSGYGPAWQHWDVGMSENTAIRTDHAIRYEVVLQEVYSQTARYHALHEYHHFLTAAGLRSSLT